MEQVAIYKFEKSEVRTTVIDNEPWFVGKDVASILGYKRTADAIRQHVHVDDRGVCEIPTPGGSQNMAIVNESGMYALIFGSKLEAANEFKRWVTKEVLPSIRKHGAYMDSETIEKALSNPDTIIQLAQTLKDEQEKVKKLQPKADYYDQILVNKSLTPVTLIAKDYGMSAYKFNRLLHEYGIQFNRNGTWILYQKYAAEAYTATDTHIVSDTRVKNTTKWTQKGRIFLYEELKKRGILPSIEKLGSEGGKAIGSK